MEETQKMNKTLKIYYSHGWNDGESMVCLDGNIIPSGHPKYVKQADILIFKLNEDGEISKGILNEIQAAQEVGIPIYQWNGKELIPSSNLTPQTAPLKKWKRNFKNTEHPFRRCNNV